MFEQTIITLRAAFAALLVLATLPPAFAESPALWRMADEDSEVWLFGTIHVLPRDVAWRTKTFDDALRAADTVYLEADVAAQDVTRFPVLLRQIGLNRNFVTLSSILGGPDTRRLIRIAERIGFQPGFLEPLRPWVASLALGQLQRRSEGVESRWGADAVIEALAHRSGKRLGYLETVEQHYMIFASLSAEAEKALLLSTLDSLEMKRAGKDRLIGMWLRGEPIDIDNGPTEVHGVDLSGFRDAIFVKRNKAWVGEIARIMAGSGKTFIAVGAGHMPGKEGVIALLRAKGFKVKRI